jgi:hypothetical protein
MKAVLQEGNNKFDSFLSARASFFRGHTPYPFKWATESSRSSVGPTFDTNLE